MIQALVHDPLFLGIKSKPATKEDRPVAADLLDRHPMQYPNPLKMAIIRQYSAYQSWQASACLHFLHRILLEFLHIFSPSEFCRSRFSSDRGKTTANT